MWISKKKYNELISERDNYHRIASETIQLNGRVIDSNERILEEIKGVQELNHNLQQHNDVLVAYTEDLKAKLDFMTEQRDYYYNLLKDTGEVHVGL
jgi:hypothetical protein